MSGTEEEQKRIIKEAIHEWLDEKYAAVGRWTTRGFLAMVLAALVYLVLWANGWHRG